jgi:hypothetical protein
MSLLDRIIPKTTFPQQETVIEGTITRFGMSMASEHRNTFVFRIQGREEVFEIRLDTGHDQRRIGLVAAGDRIRASGHMKDRFIRYCAFVIEAGQDRLSFEAPLQLLG